MRRRWSANSIVFSYSSSLFSIHRRCVNINFWITLICFIELFYLVYCVCFNNSISLFFRNVNCFVISVRFFCIRRNAKYFAYQNRFLVDFISTNNFFSYSKGLFQKEMKWAESSKVPNSSGSQRKKWEMDYCVLVVL